LPALAVLLRKGLRQKMLPNQLLTRMAWMALALIPLALFFSAASGRMTLYLFPVSMFVLTGFISSLGDIHARAGVRTFLSISLVIVLAYWLNFANSSRAHNPYGNALLVGPSGLAL
jgi:hypothetical protein